MICSAFTGAPRTRHDAATFASLMGMLCSTWRLCVIEADMDQENTASQSQASWMITSQRHKKRRELDMRVVMPSAGTKPKSVWVHKAHNLVGTMRAIHTHAAQRTHGDRACSMHTHMLASLLDAPRELRYRHAYCSSTADKNWWLSSMGFSMC
jgi:hypothetical protein